MPNPVSAGLDLTNNSESEPSDNGIRVSAIRSTAVPQYLNYRLVEPNPGLLVRSFG